VGAGLGAKEDVGPPHRRWQRFDVDPPHKGDRPSEQGALLVAACPASGRKPRFTAEHALRVCGIIVAANPAPLSNWPPNEFDAIRSPAAFL
jgi:hypothetical protein